MKTKNYFSVIIPTFNSSKFIFKTLDSVSNQSYKHYEIIIVDDGSTDNTVHLIKNYFLDKNEIDYRLIEKKNSGPSAARNSGIKIAKFDWLAFLDSDDIWCNNKLKTVNNYINNNLDCNFFCHNEEVLLLNGKKILNNYNKNFNNNISISKQLYSNNLFSTSAVVCKKSLIINYNLFNENLLSAQDYELWLKISNDLKVKFIPHYLGIYIERKDNISNSKFLLRLVNLLKIKIIHRSKVSKITFIINLLKVFFYHFLIPIIKLFK